MTLFNKWSNIGFGEEIGIIKMKICTLSGALISTTAFYDISRIFVDIN